MQYLSELDVINDQLATLGESPVNAVDEDHPMIAAGLRLLRTASYREQAKRWWFNEEIITLYPDPTNGNILTPDDAMSVDPVQPSRLWVQRGRRLYNTQKNNYDFTGVGPVCCKLLRLIPFEDLPPSAQSVIGIHAVLDFQKAYDADRNKTQLILADLSSAQVILSAEHIRNQNVNMLATPAMAYKLNQLGYSVALGGVRN